MKRARECSVAVVGTGYVGLTTAACLAHLGRSVMGIDIDEQKVRSLAKGLVPIVERGVDELVYEGLESGRLTFTTSYESVRDSSIVMLCLPTPHGPDGLDLRHIESAANLLRSVLRPQSIVVTKSTVPVGTHARLAAWLARSDVSVVSNPEFLREGTAVSDFLMPDRIVVGADTEEAARRVAAVYDGIEAEVQFTDPASAEMIKYATNSFLATKLSFVNEMSRLCDRLGGDILAVTRGMGSDHRIGAAFLRPGPGWGGSCFPKDSLGLANSALGVALDLPVAASTHRSNLLHFEHVTGEIERLCPQPLARARIAVWGAAFKGGTGDTRESPSLEIVRRLSDRGATVTVYDPVVAPAAIPVPSVANPYSACSGADLLVVLTDWPEFAQVDLEKVADSMAGNAVYDTRYMIDVESASAAGLDISQPGRALRAS